ncbi:glycosyltransferase family 4 protein [Acetobacteraceae bacterium KSS8]|uniref:Glycosyltransferase family 4 protein n=1 Tax=Endosaccharibacter trunci TaxID=2812733 RepID=A0ABT1W8A0_9PROT|nr:glycosyltransferase family 4 protein [Acetobacteraceae bacterium KSS8]
MASPVIGRIDEAGRNRVRGWACDGRRPRQAVSLLVLQNGVLLGRVLANRFRQDLFDAGVGCGRHGFDLPFNDPLSPLRPHEIRVIVEETGEDLPHSPWILQPAATLDAEVLDGLGRLLQSGLSDTATIDQRTGFLLDQLDRLRQQRAQLVEAHGKPGQAGPDVAEATAGRVPLALVLDEVLPDPTRDAGSNAVLSHMRSLARLGYRVMIAAADREAPPGLVRALAAEDILCCAPPFYPTIEDVLIRHGAGINLIYLHRGSIGSRYARLARHYCPKARLVLSVADLEHVRLKRQAEAECRPELLPVAQQARLHESDALAQADVILTHSSREADALRKALPMKPVHRVMWRPAAQPIATPFAARYGVVFLADYAHAPNMDAVRRLVHDIMPLVWEHDPTLPCLLAGSRLPHGLDGGDPRLRWIGHVPVLQTLFERVRLSVAPLAFGAGVKGKVLESLAAGVPCACSPIAAEGLDLPAALAPLVAEDTHGMAQLILALHGIAAVNATMARAGLDWAARLLSEDAIDSELAAATGAPRPVSRTNQAA